MRDVILIFMMALVAIFLFRGEPNLYDLLHKRAIEAAHTIKEKE